MRMSPKMVMPWVVAHLRNLIVGPLTFAVAVGACANGVGNGGDQGAVEDPVVGATADGETNIVSDGWEESSIRFGNNVKMLNFRQLKAEVARATGVTYDWGDKGVIFGEADYKTSFHDDRTPSATKLIAFRKAAFAICKTMVTAEAQTPSVFSALSPNAALSAEDPKVAAQVKLVFNRFFLEEPTQDEVDLSIKALVAQGTAGTTPAEAWAGLCTGYLSSMRFLSY